jgi:polyisoprenyl-phosphate glycosyltransferase
MESKSTLQDPQLSLQDTPTLSIVIPALNEASNLEKLYHELVVTLDGAGILWECMIVDDASDDDTYRVLTALTKRDRRIRAIRFSRHFGSHAAIRCALDYISGKCAAILAADLQDPPDILVKMLAPWREGAQVVWAVREKRDEIRAVDAFFSRLFYVLMRRMEGLKRIPKLGADCFLIDRIVIDALKKCGDAHQSLFNMLFWLGFIQKEVFYSKRPRFHGRSGWSLGRKLKLVADSVACFSAFPIRFMIYLGFVSLMTGCLCPVLSLVGLQRVPDGVPLWPIATFLILCGLQMMLLGVLGEYLWRFLGQARGRPSFFVEKTFD